MNDPNYLGKRHRRLIGPDYYDMVDEFMHAVYGRWPDAIVQFEDFETPKAVPLLARYKDKAMTLVYFDYPVGNVNRL